MVLAAGHGEVSILEVIIIILVLHILVFIILILVRLKLFPPTCALLLGGDHGAIVVGLLVANARMLHHVEEALLGYGRLLVLPHEI